MRRRSPLAAALKAAIRFVILPDPLSLLMSARNVEGPSSVVHAAATKSSDKTAAFLLPRNSLMRLHLAGKKKRPFLDRKEGLVDHSLPR